MSICNKNTYSAWGGCPYQVDIQMYTLHIELKGNAQAWWHIPVIPAVER